MDNDCEHGVSGDDLSAEAVAHRYHYMEGTWGKRVDDTLRWYWKVDDNGTLHIATDVDAHETVDAAHGWRGPFASDDDAYADHMRTTTRPTYRKWCEDCRAWVGAWRDEDGYYTCSQCWASILCDECGRLEHDAHEHDAPTHHYRVRVTSQYGARKDYYLQAATARDAIRDVEATLRSLPAPFTWHDDDIARATFHAVPSEVHAS